MTALVSTEIQVTVGVDTHADLHVAAALDQLGRLLATQSVPSMPAGYRALIACEHGWLAGSPPGTAPLLSLSPKMCADAWPGLWPAIGACDGPQCHQWINVSTRPVHATALEWHLATILLALSVLPLPIGYPAAWNAA